MADRLFARLERIHGERPWGRVLDAGTGEHSLKWLLGLAPRHITAVTGSPPRQRKLERLARPVDRVVLGDWADPAFLHGEVYDVVVADYLLGALDGFAPYFQEHLFERLRPHVGGSLYVVGLEPLPDSAEGEAQRLVLEIDRLRDACIKLAGHRCYREYPRDWVVRRLEGSGYEVSESVTMPIVYRERWVNGQLDVCRRKLPYLREQGLRDALEAHIEGLRERALPHAQQGIRLGADYLVIARPAG